MLIALMTAIIFFIVVGCNDTDGPVDPGERQAFNAEATRYIYFISDIHLGPNYSTNWYQASVHKDHFKAILRFIQDKEKNVGDVVILGDWFDFQVYDLNFSPDRHSKRKYAPVTLQQIIDAHPELFTRQTGVHSGDFITLMDTISGNIHYINGNHDHFLTVDDINDCLAAVTDKRIVSTNPDPLKNDVYATSYIHAEHGHEHTLFNGTYDHDNGLYHVPAGYFIARIQADQSNYWLRQRGLDNAAQLEDFGNQAPGTTGYLSALLASMPRPSGFAGHMFEAYIDVYKDKHPITDETAFVMPDLLKMDKSARSSEGSFTMKLERVKTMFPELFRFFSASSWGALKRDRSSGLNAYGKKSLDKYKIVIYGHTHMPTIYQKDNQKGSPVYVNSGYNCPNAVSMQAAGENRKYLAFVEIEESERHLYVTLKAVKDTQGKYEVFDYRESRQVNK
jgi:UDP-2,3-diacylglucosamine pyrophosphatase LpxH